MSPPGISTGGAPPPKKKKKKAVKCFPQTYGYNRCTSIMYKNDRPLNQTVNEARELLSPLDINMTCMQNTPKFTIYRPAWKKTARS